MSLQITNNAQSTLAAGLGAGDVTLNLSAGEGGRFPSLNIGDWFPLYLLDISAPQNYEICRATARSGDAITIQRSQEGTAAKAFAAGDVVELRMTAKAYEEFARSGLVDLTVLNGLNYARAQGSPDAMIASVAGVGDYTEGLNIRVKTLGENTMGNVTINVNDLGSVPIRLADDLPLRVGSITENTVIDITYDASDGIFVLNNATFDVNMIPNSQTGLPGLVKYRAGISAQYVESNDASVGGYVDEDGVSRIIRQYADTLSENYLPFIWRHLGRGTSTVIANGNKFILPGAEYNFRNYTLASGARLEGRHSGSSQRGSGTILIRAQGKVTISGNLVLADGQTSIFNSHHVGPQGGNGSNLDTIYTNAGFSVKDTLQFGPQYTSGGYADPLLATYLSGAIKSGASFDSFRGGRGSGYWALNKLRGDQYDDTDEYVRQDQMIEPCGAIIIVAREIQFTSTARVEMNSRAHPFAASEVTAGDSGGGMIIACCPAGSLDVNTSAQFAAGKSPSLFLTADQWSADRGINGQAQAPNPETRKCKAGNGQFFHLDTLSGNVFDIF